MGMVSDSGTVGIAAGRGQRPALVASARLSRAALALGALGIASSLFVIARLAGAWRLTSASAAHQISILGHRLTYPSANLDAIAVLLLALVGLAVIARVLAGAVGQWTRAARLTRRLSERASPGPDGALVIEDERPMAFCAGLLHPRIYITTAAVAALDEDALRAVIAHEGHHASRRDPLRFAAEHVLAHSLFFVPGVGELVCRHHRAAELSADESAINAGPGNRAALARAMLSFSDGREGSAGIDAARVDHLLGDAPGWSFPLVLAAGGVAMLALVVGVCTLAARVAAGSATLSLPVLSAQPCIVVLAMIPMSLGSLAVFLARRARR